MAEDDNIGTGEGEGNPSFVDSEGNFTESFSEQLGEWLGEEHAETKAFESITNLSGLAKAYADTKSMVGKRLEVPGDDASDEQKAEYNKAMGIPDSAEGYELAVPENLPEGMEYNEDFANAFKGIFHEAKISKGQADILAAKFNEMQIKMYNDAQAAEQAAFTQSVDKLKADWTGDSIVENPRLAFKAIREFGDDNLKRLIDVSKVYESPSDFAKWAELGYSPDQLRVWHLIGKSMQSGLMHQNEGDPTAKAESDLDRAKRMYPNSPQLTGAKT
jgi:hypothetical protein